jgi:hypothetical protein
MRRHSAGHLRDSVHDVAEDSPIVAELDRRAQSAAHFGDAVWKGAPFEHAQRDFQNIQVALAQPRDAQARPRRPPR